MTPDIEPVFALAVGAHPDDVELACGGTLASLARAGHRVAICHLTRGEAGTRGDPETRRREAEAAAEVLGVAELRFTDAGDGALRTGPSEEDALIDIIRELRPRLVLGHGEPDRHPDHERAGRLTRDALFYARLVKRRAGAGYPAHRDAQLWRFRIHGEAAPEVVVPLDAASLDRKLAALRCYRSQFASPPAGGGTSPGEADPHADATPTWVSSDAFWASVTARARRAGAAIEHAFGEGFVPDRPVAVDPSAILGAGPSPRGTGAGEGADG